MKTKATFVHIFILIAFLANMFGPVPWAQADDGWAALTTGFHLPVPGVMVHLSPPLDPPILKGIKVHPNNPFRFDFILDRGDFLPKQEQLKMEATKLIKYFLASLTIPEKDLWVNLSPYEKDRIIPPSFGLTEMGRDLLAEDYMLKQITASLIYPEDAIGKKFWKRIYEEAAKKFGTTDIPVNTFNKVWIVPEKAVVYENTKANTAYVVKSKLKVMLEQDYLSQQKHNTVHNDLASVGANIVREIVIPELTKEVNENKNFAQLRQVYNSCILAAWCKKKIKDSILAQVYDDQNKIKGTEYTQSILPQRQPQKPVILKVPQANHPNDVEAIYQRYLQAFKKGVYNYIKEEKRPNFFDSNAGDQITVRKYFSGGITDLAMKVAIKEVPIERLQNIVGNDRANSLLVAVDMAMAEGNKNEDVSNKKDAEGDYAMESVLKDRIDEMSRLSGIIEAERKRLVENRPTAMKIALGLSSETGDRAMHSKVELLLKIFDTQPLARHHIEDLLILWGNKYGFKDSYADLKPWFDLGEEPLTDIDEFLDAIPLGSHFLGSGLSAFVLQTPDRHALRISKIKTLRLKIEGLLQPVETHFIGEYRLEKLPLVPKISPQELGIAENEINIKLKKQGYHLKPQEVNIDNISIFEGQYVVIDPGAIEEDRAMLNNGGIDFTPPNMHVQTQIDSRFHGNDKEGIKFHIDAAMLQRFREAPGLTPVLVDIEPLNNVQQFLGINETVGNPQGMR